MTKSLRAALALLFALVACPVVAQTLAEASEAAKKMHHEWPADAGLLAVGPTAPTLTEADWAALDRPTFDKVYAAGKVVDNARFQSAVGVSARQFQLAILALHTELSVVFDKATTKADKALAAQYQQAELQFSLGAAQADGRATRAQGKIGRAHV